MFAKGRARYPKKTHCKYGHPLSGDNVRFYRNRRHCRTCARLWTRAKRAAA
jgi:hypothetical protein